VQLSTFNAVSAFLQAVFALILGAAIVPAQYLGIPDPHPYQYSQFLGNLKHAFLPLISSWMFWTYAFLGLFIQWLVYQIISWQFEHAVNQTRQNSFESLFETTTLCSVCGGLLSFIYAWIAVPAESPSVLGCFAILFWMFGHLFSAYKQPLPYDIVHFNLCVCVNLILSGWKTAYLTPTLLPI
jgi:hypothetical protein